jgi:hypothetical protein
VKTFPVASIAVLLSLLVVDDVSTGVEEVSGGGGAVRT